MAFGRIRLLCRIVFHLDVLPEMPRWMHCLDINSRTHFWYYCFRSCLHLQLRQISKLFSHELRWVFRPSNSNLKFKLRYLCLHLLGCCWCTFHHFALLLQQNQIGCCCVQMRRSIRCSSLWYCFGSNLANNFCHHSLGCSHYRYRLARCFCHICC